MTRSGKEHAGVLQYQQHRLKPEELLTFIEMPGFIDDWDGLKLDVEVDLLALQVAIMARPKFGRVVQGTGGLRKLQYGPPQWSKGKRDAMRVCYVYFEEFAIVLLVMAYSKAQKDDLSAQEKKAIRKLIEREREAFSQRSYR